MRTLKDWQAISEGSLVSRGTVVALEEDGGPIRVRCLVDENEDLLCEILAQADNQSPALEPGDQVLVWRPSREGEAAVVLGRIGARPKSEPAATAPDELVMEAKHSLTLRVGAGSITIREDGKILIKGKDLVSHAQRLNRIKGGAVQIN